MPGDVVQRTQRTGREQRVTGPKQEPGIRRLPLGEPLDQRRLADAGLARQQDDAAARRRRGQHGAQLLQQRGALEQVHHNATLRLSGLHKGERVPARAEDTWPQLTRPEELARAILRLQSLAAAGESLGPAVARPVDSPPMTNLDEHGRPEPPRAADETATLLGFLGYQRATLAWKCSGLDAAGLGATVAASSMTLGGMLKHLAYVEDLWCSRWLHGRDPELPWDTVDWKADPDWDWHSAAEDSPERLHALWQDAVARSRSLVAEALADGGLERLAQRTWPDGRAPSLRWILVHLVEEYARHNGHADLLRESVDGLTGE
jgi:uncharacterized damage-inducible protein DinB